MQIINAKIAYSNKNYHIVILEEPLVEEGFESQPQSYGIYNRVTDVLEGYSTYLPGAIQIATGLSEKLTELLPKEDNVVMFEPDSTLE